MTTYRNAQEAFLGELGEIELFGHEVMVRGSATRELTARTFTILRPLERCISVQGRLNSIVAMVAETVWVLGGRNDLDFLSRYLPRASDFSDDGKTWRAGYGPRMRNWQGIDQLAQVVQVLRAEPTSRRALISLYDPAIDSTDTKDVPCNNWIHFLHRNGHLDMSIAVRSNDIIWGFSGINTFEWSVVHEIVARAIGAQVGSQHWFVSSMHLYERHFERAATVLQLGPGTGVYERGSRSVTYEGTWEDLDAHLSEWFGAESLIRAGSPEAYDVVNGYPEPLLRAFLRLVHSHWLMVSGDREGASRAIAPLGGTDLGVAMADYVARRNRQGRSTLVQEPSHTDDTRLRDLRGALRTLHRRKNAAYGDSWKRRGELVGVLANVARKVDRLANLRNIPTGDPESWTDTLVDLAIYLLKYLTFLADIDTTVAQSLFEGATGRGYSDGVEGFEALLERTAPIERPPRTAIPDIAATFERLETGARLGTLTAGERADFAQEMARVCVGVLLRRPPPKKRGEFDPCG